jgi:hypothetical protein
LGAADSLPESQAGDPPVFPRLIKLFQSSKTLEKLIFAGFLERGFIWIKSWTLESPTPGKSPTPGTLTFQSQRFPTSL